MDNFDLRTFLAEGKLHEAELRPLSDEQFETIAQRIADELTSADDLDIKYSITPGSIENDTPLGGGFDLDAERGPNTPGDDWKDDRGFTIDQYVGEGDGGSYTVKPNEDGSGYIVRNAAMMNTEVAIVSLEGDSLEIEMVPQDEFLPRSSDEAASTFKKAGERAGFDMRGINEEEKKSNKMKKSELKEMIKASILNEVDHVQEEEGTFGKFKKKLGMSKVVRPTDADYDAAYKHIEANYPEGYTLMSIGVDAIQDKINIEVGDFYHDSEDIVIDRPSVNEEEFYPDPEESGAELEDLYQMDQEMLDKLKADVVDPDDPFDEELELAMDNDDMMDNMMEAKKDEDKDEDKKEEDDVEVELEDEDVEMEPATSDKGLTGAKKVIDDSLEAALEAARELGDEKLEAQIGNTITFFTRSQIVKNTSGKEEDAPEMDMDMESEEETLQEVKRMQRIAGIIK